MTSGEWSPHCFLAAGIATVPGNLDGLDFISDSALAACPLRGLNIWRSPPLLLPPPLANPPTFFLPCTFCPCLIAGAALWTTSWFSPRPSARCGSPAARTSPRCAAAACIRCIRQKRAWEGPPLILDESDGAVILQALWLGGVCPCLMGSGRISAVIGQIVIQQLVMPWSCKFPTLHLGPDPLPSPDRWPMLLLVLSYAPHPT